MTYPGLKIQEYTHQKMTEKKIIVYELRLSYNGPVKIESFFKEVEDWIKRKGMQKELKKKMERLAKKGKKLEWTIECWKNYAHHSKEVVRMRSMFNDVKDVEIKRKGKRIKTQQADVLLIFDGILETDLSQKWEQKPLFYFARALVDRYIWKFYTERYDGIVAEDTYDMQRTLQAFFNLQKMSVQ
jgi:hypothetical protein